MTEQSKFDFDEFLEKMGTCDACGDVVDYFSEIGGLPSILHLKERGRYCEGCRASFDLLRGDVQDIGKLVNAALSTWRNHRRDHACVFDDCQIEKYLYDIARDLERLSGEAYRRNRYYWECPKCGWEYDGEIGYDQGNEACPDCWIEERHLWGWRYLKGR